MPRTVPFLKLDARLACAMTGLSPWDLNSFWQNARAKKPRESSLRSRSITKAPFSLVSVKITTQLLIDDPYPLPQTMAQGQVHCNTSNLLNGARAPVKLACRSHALTPRCCSVNLALCRNNSLPIYLKQP